MPISAGADHSELLAVAEQLARGAGDLVGRARAAGNGLGADAKSSPTDLVTEVDRASERWLAERLAALRPDDAVLGEEGADRAGGSGVRWLLDPIDGTVNFLYGLRPYAVSVAAERDGRVVAGCVHDPSSGETFGATLGGGARLDGRPLGGRWLAPALDRAVIGTGFGYDAGLRGEQGRVLAGCFPGSATCAGSAPPRWTSATWPRAGWTATTSTASSRGTGPPASWSPRRPAPG